VMAAVQGPSRYILLFKTRNLLCLSLASIGISLFIVMCWLAAGEMVRRFRRQLFLCLSVCLLPLLAMFFLDVLQSGALLVQERFWMFGLAGFIPLAGYVLSYSFARIRLAVFVLAGLMFLSSLVCRGLDFGPAPKAVSEWINSHSRNRRAAVIVYNIRSAVIAQAYYLNDDIYLIPVADAGQLENALRACRQRADTVFICRHYHPTDAILMDQPFMRGEGIDFSGFGFKEKLMHGYVEAREYTQEAQPQG